MNLVSLLGLACDLAGSAFIVRGLIISKRYAIDIETVRFTGATDEINLRRLQVKDRLKQSLNAKIGLVFLILGFLLQAYANL